MQVDDIFEMEINKLKNFRYLYLEQLNSKNSQQKLATVQETDKYLAWSLNLCGKNALNNTDESPTLSSKEDVIYTNNSQQSVQGDSFSTPTSEEENYFTQNTVKMSYSNNGEDEKLPAVNSSSGGKYYQQEEQLEVENRITAGCNCHYMWTPITVHQQDNPLGWVTPFYSPHCCQNFGNFNSKPSLPSPCYQYAAYQSCQPSCTWRTSDLNTEELCRRMKEKKSLSRKNSKNTVASKFLPPRPKQRSHKKIKPKHLNNYIKSQILHTAKNISVPNQSVEKSNNAKWANANQEEKTITTGSAQGKKTIPAVENQKKTANKTSSKNTSDPAPHQPQKTSKTYNAQHVVGEYVIRDMRNKVPESVPNYKTNKVIDKNNKVKRDYSKIAQSTPKTYSAQLVGEEHDLSDIRNNVPKSLPDLPNENDVEKEHKPLQQESQMPANKPITLGENSPTKISQQQTATKTDSNPSNKPATEYLQASSEKETVEEKLPQQVPTQQQPSEQRVSQELKIQVSRIPTPTSAKLNNHLEDWRSIQYLDDTPRFSVQHNLIQIKFEEPSLQSSQGFQNKPVSQHHEASPKIDHQRALQLLKEAHVPDIASSSPNSNNQSFHRNLKKVVHLTNNTQTFATGQRQVQFDEQVLKDSSRNRIINKTLPYNTQTVSTGHRLDQFDDPNSNSYSSDSSFHHYPKAQSMQLYRTKLQNAQKEYESLCEFKCKERNYQRQLDINQQLMHEPFKRLYDQKQQATRIHTSPNNSTVCKKGMRLVTFEDERGLSRKLNTAVCHSNNSDWKRVNEYGMIGKVDYADPEQYDDYNGESSFIETCVSSSSAEFTCDESFEDDYATCDESQTECEDTNGVPPFYGCLCTYDEFLQLASF